MPEKAPTAYSFITYAWIVFLSAWGGVISLLRKLAGASDVVFI